MSTMEHPSVFVHQQIFRESDIPVRSRLYCLEPQAMGSLWQECFTSYLNRLGWLHHVSPRAMVTQEIIPRLDKAQEVSRQWIGALSRGYAMNMNGVGSLALEWSQALNHLTQRSDLHLLTLYGWIGNLSSTGHLRPCLAWCPICYTEWQEQRAYIYQPLFWLFKVVTLCPKHHRLLESHCPHCQKQQSVIALRTRPGHCTQCDQWLGSSLDEKLSDQVMEVLTPWQQWVLQALEELHVASRASGVLQWEPFFYTPGRGDSLCRQPRHLETDRAFDGRETRCHQSVAAPKEDSFARNNSPALLCLRSHSCSNHERRDCLPHRDAPMRDLIETRRISSNKTKSRSRSLS